MSIMSCHVISRVVFHVELPIDTPSRVEALCHRGTEAEGTAPYFEGFGRCASLRFDRAVA